MEGKPTQNRILKYTLVFVAVIVVFIAGMLGGVAYDRSRQVVDLTKFWDTYELIQKRYVGEIDKSKASEGAVKGLVESLGDPFSMYLDTDAKKALSEELSGSFEGIGAMLDQKDGAVTIIAPLAASPAAKIGLKAGDIIIKVDGKSTEGKSVDEVAKTIRGPKGTEVIVTVYRQGEDAPLDFKIVRENIKVDSVTSSMKGADSNIGYISISQFGDDTVELTQKAVNDLVAKNPKALIIDLRNNPGGYLNAVAPIAGLFIPPSVIVREQFKGKPEEVIRSVATPVMPTTPIYILVNNGSASAAEILAGALQDYKRAILVGSKTYGKGSVQDIVDLKDESALRITIAEWLTPNSRHINKVGIEPDVAVTGDKTATSDAVLDKTIELINTR